MFNLQNAMQNPVELALLTGLLASCIPAATGLFSAERAEQSADGGGFFGVSGKASMAIANTGLAGVAASSAALGWWAFSNMVH